MNANAITTTIAKQFDALAPTTLTIGRRAFRLGGVYVFDNAAGSVCFSFVGSKRRGAFAADKVAVTVAYVKASDAYRIRVQYCDGATFDVVELAELADCGVHSFESLAGIVADSKLAA